MSSFSRIASLLFGLAPLACAAEEAKPNGEGPGGCETGDACADDTDCGADTRCNEDACTRLYCLPDNSPCVTNEVCKSEACAHGPPGNVCLTGPRPAGWACSAMYGCASGLACILGTCTAPNLLEGEPCTGDEQCAAGLFCHTPTCVSGSTGLCSRPGGTDEICCDATECASPYACVNVTCSGNVRKRCGSRSGVGQSCCDASDCQSGLVCDPAAGFTPLCRADSAPALRVMPESLTLSMVQGGLLPGPATLFVSNAGTGALNFGANSSSESSFWLLVEPIGGTVFEGQGTVELTVTVADAGYEIGTLEGSILVYPSDSFAVPPLEIPVTFTISAP